MIKDNKLIDLIAAVLAGVGLSWLDLSSRPTLLIPLTLKDILLSATVNIGALVVAALLLFIWKHRWRTQLGWAATAVIGVTIASATDEILYRSRATAEELNFMPEFSPFPMKIVLYVMPALLFMGVAHYVGLLIASRSQKYA